MTETLLIDRARELGVALTPAQAQAFELYYRVLVDWNSRVNLTTITEREQVIVKHFLDSLSIAPLLRRYALSDQARLIDVGSGAGFPGLPLKIAFPALRLTLLEATGKKVEFLKYAIAQLKLQEATAVHTRAENLARDPAHREQHDVAVARAVANLATLLEYALPFVRVGGMFVAQKGTDVEDETRDAEHALEVLGGRVSQVVPVNLPGLEPRHLIVVEKTGPTPSTYPRRAGVPERKPLTK